MTSPALLTDIVLTSLELLAIVVGVAFIGLGGVKLVFLIVSPNFTTFLVLPDPTPIWSWNHYPHNANFAFSYLTSTTFSQAS
jgi:hypothetical protein